MLRMLHTKTNPKCPRVSVDGGEGHYARSLSKKILKNFGQKGPNTNTLSAMSKKKYAQTNDPNSPLSMLTDRQRQFALFMSEGKPVKTAMRLAGYGKHASHNGLASRMMKNPTIQTAVRHLHKRYENSVVASRKMVLEGFLEAIEQAKMQSDAAVQIAGWREIGKMCGYYAPEVKEVNVNVGAKRVIGQLEVMSDAQLLEMIEQDRAAIEGEVMDVTEQADLADPIIPDDPEDLPGEASQHLG